MSYILDALKRAESERSRGAIPNIHAQPGLAADGDASGPAIGRRAAVMVAVAAVFASAVAWWWMSTDDAQAPIVVADAALSAASPVPPAAAPVAAASIPSPALAARLPASAAAPVPTAPAQGYPLPWAAQKAAVPQTAPLPRQSKAAAGAGVAEPAVTDGASAAAAASASDRVYTLKELPDNIRSSLPVLTVGGATYSENAASRMLIINGNLFHEGDKLTPELTLQQIKLRAAVLSFRGYRYSISY